MFEQYKMCVKHCILCNMWIYDESMLVQLCIILPRCCFVLCESKFRVVNKHTYFPSLISSAAMCRPVFRSGKEAVRQQCVVVGGRLIEKEMPFIGMTIAHAVQAALIVGYAWR